MGFSTKLLKQIETFQDDERNESDGIAIVLVTVYNSVTLTCELCLFQMDLHNRPSCQFSSSSSLPDKPGSGCLVCPPWSSESDRDLRDLTDSKIFTSWLSLCSAAPHHNQFNLPELSSLLCFLLQTFRITIFFIICHSHLQIFSPKIFFFSSSFSGIEKYVSIFFCLFFSLE